MDVVVNVVVSHGALDLVSSSSLVPEVGGADQASDAGGSGEVLVHEVSMRESDGYAQSEELRVHSILSEVDWLHRKREPTSAVRVERRPVWASYPISRRVVHLCAFEPGQSARHRANFRLSGYSMTWTYHDWTINIAHESPRDDLFIGRKYDFERDDRVSLYGKRARR
jgi:hypothetical protein